MHYRVEAFPRALKRKMPWAPAFRLPRCPRAAATLLGQPVFTFVTAGVSCRSPPVAKGRFSGNGKRCRRTSTLALEAVSIADELVTAGYPALTRRHHPDAGGDHRTMVLVNTAASWLREDVRGAA
jgi:hypothetical protein